ncbi:hypothetical protein Y1Q_0020925 [Alligator mississippiensis]|uniref:Uncharacterized protein n=1 Tax=Alligator mississippiensis TaxID=8496 RepID=A0A151NK89_ALLMI|nr:hypothetical protein Y1Q_0020925 [Alligator mississippiensis]
MHLTVRTGANRREHWKPGVAFIPGGRQCVALKRGNPSDMDMGNIGNNSLHQSETSSPGFASLYIKI